MTVMFTRPAQGHDLKAKAMASRPKQKY